MKSLDNTYLHKKFHINIQHLNNRQIFSLAVISISGGQDSLCLIKLLHDLRNYYGALYNTHYVYIDHQWKQDSKNQIKHLINFMQTIKEKLYIYQINDIVISETQARKVRYQILINHCIEHKSSLIITAHTATDQLETFLHQLIRGSSIDGATNLRVQRILENNIQLWRPLISFTRTEINWFCRRYYLPVWLDSTNHSYYIQRNRIRYELIPYLKRYFQQNIDKKINNFLWASSIDNEYIKQNSVKLYLISRHSKSIAINYSLIKIQHISLQIRTLQVFFYHNLNRSLNNEILYKLISKLDNNIINASSISWKNINIKIHNRWIYIY